MYNNPWAHLREEGGDIYVVFKYFVEQLYEQP